MKHPVQTLSLQSAWITFIPLTAWVYLHTNRMFALKATEYRS